MYHICLSKSNIFTTIYVNVGTYIINIHLKGLLFYYFSRILNEETTESQTLESLTTQIHQCFIKQDHYKGLFPVFFFTFI